MHLRWKLLLRSLQLQITEQYYLSAVKAVIMIIAVADIRILPFICSERFYYLSLQLQI